MEFKPVRGKVFVERNADIDELHGIKVSQRALTKALTGRIKAIEENEHVEIGDVIHLPHYGVNDVDINGVEYAYFHKDDLFLKYVDGEPLPICRYVHVRKCINDHYRDDDGDVFLERTDEQVENTNYVQIIAHADDCTSVSNEDIGAFFFCPEQDERLRRIEYSKDYMVHEDLINFTLTEIPK